MGAVAALVLVGGRARRFDGAAKPLQELGGSTPWQRTLAAFGERGVAPVVAVGAAWDTDETAPMAGAANAPVIWVREDPPYGGPVAAIAAGLPLLAGVEWALLLAGDLVHPADVVRTLCDAVRADEGENAAPDPVDAIVFRADDRAQWLAGAYRVAAVRAALTAIVEPSGAAARELLGGLPTRWIPDEDGITADIDTPADLERARAVLADPPATHDPYAHHDEESR
ncbi:Molybdenum cofactor guanylyltransferase [Microbacterium azadirachtae]|uniref:Molybdenum cofactor guanylyltransferase n=1 Tax=Microbacterium azadirachtae TaxID=582680 RepID=A0A0F0LNC9_9MICO|nr:Molybdenum cofactor guanylyltransferase [Microbacterium azadirachtae]